MPSKLAFRAQPGCHGDRRLVGDWQDLIGAPNNTERFLP